MHLNNHNNYCNGFKQSHVGRDATEYITVPDMIEKHYGLP